MPNAVLLRLNVFFSFAVCLSREREKDFLPRRSVPLLVCASLQPPIVRTTPWRGDAWRRNKERRNERMEKRVSRFKVFVRANLGRNIDHSLIDVHPHSYVK